MGSAEYNRIEKLTTGTGSKGHDDRRHRLSLNGGVGAIHIQLAEPDRGGDHLVDLEQLGHRNGVSPALDARRI